MPKVLVTGANGLLATNVILALLEKGYKVRGLLRNSRKFNAPIPDELELTEGDITSNDALDKPVTGCDYVIHAAALTAQNFLSYQPYKLVNVDASEKLVKICIDRGVKKFVYISTANAFGFGSATTPGHEGLSISPPFTKSFYARSKLEGQQKVLQYKDKIEVTVVNPTFMIGPYDGKPSSGRIIMMGYNKKIIFCPPGGKNFVNVVDAAKGVVAALEKGKNGQAYLLAGENLSYKEFFTKLSEFSSKSPLIITIPRFLLYLAGYLGTVFRLTGIKTQLSLTNMKILCVSNFYTNRKVSDKLGVHFDATKKGIEQAVQWFKENGMIS
jgi:nucleoside-diphosphate-sugar epimerase